METAHTLQQARERQNQQVEDLRRLQRVHAKVPAHEQDPIQMEMDQLAKQIQELDATISRLINDQRKQTQ